LTSVLRSRPDAWQVKGIRKAETCCGDLGVERSRVAAGPPKSSQPIACSFWFSFSPLERVQHHVPQQLLALWTGPGQGAIDDLINVVQ
jgi:hypothetical protein